MKKLLTILALALSFNAYAETILIETATERVDNTSMGLSEIQGHNMYCGAVDGDYPDRAFFAGATLPNTEIVVDGLIAGTHYCVFTTLDINGLESVKSVSQKIFIVEEKALPKPPVVIQETINIIRVLP